MIGKKNYLIKWGIDTYKTIKLYRYYGLSKKKIPENKRAIVLMVDGRMTTAVYLTG